MATIQSFTETGPTQLRLRHCIMHLICRPVRNE